jgi:predicted PurR-regulated permease PerM
MSEEAKRKSLSRIATGLLVACLLVTVYLLYAIFRPFLSVLLWACMLVVVFMRPYRRILAMLHGRRSLASLVTCLLILALIVVPVTVVGFMMVQQSIVFYESVQQTLAGVGDFDGRIELLRQQKPWLRWAIDGAGRIFGLELGDFRRFAGELLVGASKFIVSAGPSFLQGAGGILYSFTLIFITMFFLFRDGPSLLEFIRASNPLPAAYESELIRNFEDVSYATFFGSLFSALVQGGFSSVLYWLVGIGSPLFWGALVAVISLVPVVGGVLIWVAMPVYLFLAGRTLQAIVVLVVGGVVLALIDNLLKPMIVAGRANMHPLIIFFAVLGGLEAFGLTGILVGPLIVTVFLTFLRFYRTQLEAGGAGAAGEPIPGSRQ